MVPNRRSTFGINCVRCKDELIAPEKSEYRHGAHIRPFVVLLELRDLVRVTGIYPSRGDDDGRYLSSTTRRVVKCGRVREGADRLQLRTGPLPFLKLL